MVKIQILAMMLAQTSEPTSPGTSTAEGLILKTLSRILERDLAALLFGAACMLVILIKYWNIPKKWTSANDRLARIEKRQKKFYPLFLEHIGASKYIDHDDFEEGGSEKGDD